MRQLGEYHPKKKKNVFFKIFIFTVLLTIFTAGLIRLFHLDRFVFNAPKTIVHLITDTGLKSDKDRVNVLVLGIGGDGHDGPNLTDTMILASIDKKTYDVALISIPRDLWVPDLKAKINAAYAFGQEKNDTGLKLAESTVSQLFGIPIHYGLRLDFNGFVKAVNQVGGLDIDVDNSFSDYKYPIDGKEDDLCGLKIEEQEKDGVKTKVIKDATGSATPLDQITEENDPFTCRYETISFEKGPTYMTGTTALKYVRSRHGTNGEGTDFARSARQQKVILAFRQKVISEKTLLEPDTIIKLISTFGKSIDTDVIDQDIPLFIKLGLKIEPQMIRRVVLDAFKDTSVLEVGNSSDYDGQFVLLPKNGSWPNLEQYLQSEVFKSQTQ